MVQSTKIFLLLTFIFFVINCQNEWHKKCLKREFDADSFVCVCTRDFCDQPEPFYESDFEDDQFVYYITSKSEHRLEKHKFKFINQCGKGDSSHCIGSPKIVIDPSQKFQQIFGFGGAFSDAVGINLNSLSELTRLNLLRSYFDFDKETGIGYSLGRVPIASCDFSTRVYSYLDKEDDFNLESFSLAPEDFQYKIPHILTAYKLSNETLKLFASPWSAPGWMKENGKMINEGRLKGESNGEYYQLYAKYLQKFFEKYLENGISFWAMTIQNEPAASEPDNLYGGRVCPWQSMSLDPDQQRDFAYYVLVPTFENSEATKHLKLIAHDDPRHTLLDAVAELYKDNKKSEAIDGIGVHWYMHDVDFGILKKVHEMEPKKFLMGTEACTGWETTSGPNLGDWKRGLSYGHDVLNNMRNWAIGWTDWNMCLDTNGGPNWVKNFVDSPIIVNKTADEFYKQPMFYFLAHFSKFVPRGSIRIESEDIGNEFANMTKIEHVAFVTPDDKKVIIIINMDSNPMKILIEESHESDLTKIASIEIEADSIVTLIWK